MSCCSCTTRRCGSTGGIQGVKSEDLLHSALARPVNKLAYADPGTLDLCHLAAAYAYGLASNHPFNDGNKRTAWSSSGAVPQAERHGHDRICRRNHRADGPVGVRPIVRDRLCSMAEVLLRLKRTSIVTSRGAFMPVMAPSRSYGTTTSAQV